MPGNKIRFSLDDGNKNFEILIDESRKTYANREKYDITIIEIKKNDGLDFGYFFDIDNFDNIENPNDKYRNKGVYILHYQKGNKSEYSLGTIKVILEDGVNIQHLCSTEEGSSGGPIINLENYKIIGIHKGYDDKHKVNLGTYLKEPIKDFNNKINNNEYKITIKYKIGEENKIRIF